MHALAYIPTPDPYAFLFGQQGGKSQVLLHGDDLGAGASTIATWTARHAALNGTGVGSPTVNASGWAGGGSVVMKTCTLDGATQHIAFDAEASNYSVATPFTWIVACKITANTTLRGVVGLGNSANSVNQRNLSLALTSDNASFISNKNGTSVTSTGTAITEGVQCILGVSLTAAGAVLVKQLTAGGGLVTHINTTQDVTGTLTVNKFILGGRFTSGFTTPVAGEFRFVSCYRGAGASSATLDRMMNYTRHNLRCYL